MFIGFIIKECIRFSSEKLSIQETEFELNLEPFYFEKEDLKKTTTTEAEKISY